MLLSLRLICSLVGVVGTIWFVIYSLYAFDTPAKNPRISKKERVYIENSLKKELRINKVSNRYGRWNVSK